MSNVKTNGKLYHTESEERNSISVCKRSCNEAKEKVQIHDRSWKNMELLESPKYSKKQNKSKNTHACSHVSGNLFLHMWTCSTYLTRLWVQTVNIKSNLKDTLK